MGRVNGMAVTRPSLPDGVTHVLEWTPQYVQRAGRYYPGRWGLYEARAYENDPLAVPESGWWLHFPRGDSADMLTAAVANILLRPVTLEPAWAKFTVPTALKFAVKEPVYFVRRGIAVPEDETTS